MYTYKIILEVWGIYTCSDINLQDPCIRALYEKKGTSKTKICLPSMTKKNTRTKSKYQYPNWLQTWSKQ